MKSFDQYEFTGILVPEVIVLYGMARLFPETVGFVGDKEISVGDLGLFVVLAYAAGHLIQAFGNLLENFFWRMRGGKPSDWVRFDNRPYLAAEQMPILEERVSQLNPNTTAKKIADRSAKDWSELTSQIYAIVQSAGRSQRVDIFNGNYGMFRGIATALLICLFSSVFSTHGTGTGLILLGALTILALVRMNLFGVLYARELFIQFVSLDASFIQKGKP